MTWNTGMGGVSVSLRASARGAAIPRRGGRSSCTVLPFGGLLRWGSPHGRVGCAYCYSALTFGGLLRRFASRNDTGKGGSRGVRPCFRGIASVGEPPRASWLCVLLLRLSFGGSLPAPCNDTGVGEKITVSFLNDYKFLKCIAITKRM
jgi:hypothetical protein